MSTKNSNGSSAAFLSILFSCARRSAAVKNKFDPLSDAPVAVAPVGLAGGRLGAALLLLLDDFFGTGASESSSTMKESASESGDDGR